MYLMKRFVQLAILLGGLTLIAAPAFAQGCAMCYRNAAGSSKAGQKAISNGILVLLVPPLGFMTIGMGAAVRYSRKRDKAADALDNSTEIGEQ